VGELHVPLLAGLGWQFNWEDFSMMPTDANRSLGIFLGTLDGWVSTMARRQESLARLPALESPEVVQPIYFVNGVKVNGPRVAVSDRNVVAVEIQVPSGQIVVVPSLGVGGDVDFA
jgi:hypothetical protein